MNDAVPPTPAEPTQHSDVVCEVLELASQIGALAARFDPERFNTYRAHPPDEPARSKSLFEWYDPVKWFRHKHLLLWRNPNRRTHPPMVYTPVWYVNSHRIIPNLHYYVDADGNLHVSCLQNPINEDVATQVLTPELLDTMPTDDIQSLVLMLRDQHRLQLSDQWQTDDPHPLLS